MDGRHSSYAYGYGTNVVLGFSKRGPYESSREEGSTKQKDILYLKIVVRGCHLLILFCLGKIVVEYLREIDSKEAKECFV